MIRAYQKQTLLRGTIILIIALAALALIQPTIMSIDTSTLTGWQIQIIVIIQHFFTVTPVALLAGFAWSLFGFLRYKLGDANVQYQVTKLYETWTWYEGLLLVIAAGLPIPYSLAISGIIMATKAVFNNLRATAPLPASVPPK